MCVRRCVQRVEPVSFPVRRSQGETKKTPSLSSGAPFQRHPYTSTTTTITSHDEENTEAAIEKVMFRTACRRYNPTPIAIVQPPCDVFILFAAHQQPRPTSLLSVSLEVGRSSPPAPSCSFFRQPGEPPYLRPYFLLWPRMSTVGDSPRPPVSSSFRQP
ncbi:hypothetical protein LXL04_039085 [Taraxacum kok-saghyz]